MLRKLLGLSLLLLIPALQAAPALVPGIGLFGLGASAKDAHIAADIAENTVEVVTNAERMSAYQSIS
ncbi:MAG: hypothetical protein ACO2YP_06390, partial [Pseudomonadales bacterium]